MEVNGLINISISVALWKESSSRMFKQPLLSNAMSTLSLSINSYNGFAGILTNVNNLLPFYEMH